MPFAANGGGGGGGNGGPARGPSGQIPAQDALNVLLSVGMPLTMATLVVLYFLIISPLIGPWIASGRYKEGWMLGGKKTADPEDDWGTAIRRIETAQPRTTPVQIRVVSTVYANFRCVYNKILLARVPLLGATVGQLLVVSIYQVVIGAYFLVLNPAIRFKYKRPAYLAISQLPFVFALATKNSILGVLGKGPEKLNFLHRAGLILLGILHAFFIEKLLDFKPDLSKRLYLSGVISASALLLILVTSLPIIRRKAYRFFIISHTIGWLVFVYAVNMHVPKVAFPFTAVALALYGLDVGLRFAKSRIKTASLVALAGQVVMVQVEGVAEGWRPGQYVWIRVLSTGMGYRLFESHPFTIANAPAAKSPLPGRHNLTLLSRAKGDWTGALRRLADMPVIPAQDDLDHLKVGGRTVRVLVDGPYGGPMYTDFAEAQSVLLLAGGSGITFCASVLEELVGSAAELQGNIRTRFVTLVWSMKKIEQLDWYSEMFNALVSIARNRTTLSVRIYIHVTGISRVDYCPVESAILSSNRPNVPSLLSDLMDTTIMSLDVKRVTRGGGVAIGVCGHAGLVDEARRAAGRLDRRRALKVGGVVVHSEAFSW